MAGRAKMAGRLSPPLTAWFSSAAQLPYQVPTQDGSISMTKDLASTLTDAAAGRPAHAEVSVIVPVLNEADNVGPLVERLAGVLQRCASSYEIVFVDDGSTDGTLEALRHLNEADPRVRSVSFSRNFGKEIAIAAGLDHAVGDAVVIIDADLQHQPEAIETFVSYWRQGYKNVYGQRIDRAADTRLRRLLTQRFYSLFGAFGETPLPEGAGDFRLLDRQAVTALRAMGERARFSKGLYAWIGFKSIGVPIIIDDRTRGTSKFSYRKLTRFALDGLMSFSTVPLMVWTYIGIVTAGFALFTAVYFTIETMIRGVDVPGFASLIVSVMFFSGVQLISLGVLGEYIGRIFAEVKRRPLYLVAETIGVAGESDPHHPPPGRPHLPV
jgi:glycosyltransferase involved in cell wall biosynthesis